jgi:hypothetical protein
VSYFRLIGARHDFIREDDAIGIIALRLEPPPSHSEFFKAFGDHRQIGAGLRCVQAHDHIACCDFLAFMYQDLADNAAGRMLNFFDVGIDYKPAGSDNRTSEIRGCGPSADTEY